MKIVQKGSKLIDLRNKHFYCSFLGFWCSRMIVILTQWKIKITLFRRAFYRRALRVNILVDVCEISRKYMKLNRSRSFYFRASG